MVRTVRLIRSPVSVAGMVLTTISAVVFLVVFCADLFGMHTNPYVGLLFFIVLPALFVVGLLLIPLGAWLERRRRAAGKPASELRWPRLDLNDPQHRRTAVAIFALTIVNVVIVSLGAYRGVEYMDSVQFCSSACHTVMKPEGTAHQNGPHARVACVQCHVGSGATSFAKAKMAGTRQLIALARGTYPRPIGTPVRNMVPARDTCEQCHWPEKLHGDKVKRLVEYADDEKNTESVTTMKIHVGGGSERLGVAAGIHWHMNVANQIDYIATDDKRQVIPYVRLTDRSGIVREYVAGTIAAESLAKGERRRMDCIDCHNRPAHTMAPTAERAVNEAMARGEFPLTLPFMHREAVKALTVSYPTQDAAAESIGRSLQSAYPASAPADVARAVAATRRIYHGNVFPEMQVGFGTYANNIGHVDSAGCFRCHDDNHVARDGRKISQDCETCHTIE
ncbi:MAG: cytochrome c family protein [Acidobacteria bacterium]|nr:cytochrome c family protein [Acidobacteriota bacterium]